MSDLEKDPVVHSSLSRPLFLWSALLVLCLGWALYDEVYLQRPWRSYQSRFVKLYREHLKKIRPGEAGFERQVRQSPEYLKLDRDAKEALKQVETRVREIDHELTQVVTPRTMALNESFQVLRSEVAALTYELEHTSSERSRRSLRAGIESAKKRVVTVEVPQPGGSTAKVSYTYAQLEKELAALRARRAQLQNQRVDLTRPATELAAKRDQYLANRISEASLTTLAGVEKKLDNFDTSIRQVYVADVSLVDRCETCHLGTREPLTLTKTDMKGHGVFVSHPAAELLKVHDPERFGCTPCHNGNGIAIASVETAHGDYEHWLWPLYHRENFEAGCQQCHSREIVTDLAETLNRGRELFRLRGCIGCHRYEGFDRDPEELQSVTRQLRDLEQQRAQYQREVGFRIEKGDRAASNEAAQKLYAEAERLRLRVSATDAQIEQLDIRSRSLLREVKRVGPDLKEVRFKIPKEWIPMWLQDPHRWRPGTKMPTFRLIQADLEAISAFIWQSGLDGALPHQQPGDPVKGREAFETRGCLACHSIGEGGQQMGGTFAANLSRVGEKVSYDFLVRWIHNPRERTRPYCPFEKRDLGEEDYKNNGLPYVFDLDHTRCPNDGHELVVQQMTPMPSLRLSWEEARDIATYLMTRKHPDAALATAPFLDDPKLKARGKSLVRFYGCSGCHEIAGMEEEQRIGTELTKEGSKPIDRLDFALLTGKAESEGWYTHKGFFEHKLQNPAVYDTGKVKEPQERLKMPNFNLTREDITAVTTFLLGSVDSTLPPRYYYSPAGQKEDIVEGWWVVRKYNCMGCHQIRAGQSTVFMELPRYQDPDWKEQKPPILIGEGARVRPEWLMRFLTNPSMSDTGTDRNGVRPYLKARMPTFYFSDGEIRKLVRFFVALSSQVEPYIPPKLDTLSETERTMARQLFSSEGAPCLKCHATGDATHDARATAPNFLLAKERLKPGWTRRWILDPSMIAPGTAMPSGLFRTDAERWVFAGPTPASFQGYKKDHADLLVRYMFQFTPDELARLRAAGGVGR